MRGRSKARRNRAADTKTPEGVGANHRARRVYGGIASSPDEMPRPQAGLGSHPRTGELEAATNLLRRLSFCSDGYVRSEYVARNELILEWVLAEPNARVVDIGCGYGALATTIANVTGVRVRALDVIRQRLTTVRDRPEARGHVDLLVADAELGLPLKDGIADVVVATEVLEHLHHPERLLREAKRVLRPGGRLILTTPNSKAPI